MDRVANVVRQLFWDANYNSIPFPSDGVLMQCSVSLHDIAGMTGRERRTMLSDLRVHPKLVLPFLRAMQHLTTLQGREYIQDPLYAGHLLRSAQYWGPGGDTFYSPLLGHPMSLSQDRFFPATRTSHSATSSAAAVTTTHEHAPANTGSSNHLPFAGLLNQGSTCYLNSLLQALFHLPRFRAAIYSINTVDEEPPSSPSGAKSIPLALQRLFCQLQTTKDAVATNELTASFGWSDGDSFVQHDIHELTRILLDNLEEKLEKHAKRAAASPTLHNASGVGEGASFSMTSSVTSSLNLSSTHHDTNDIRWMFLGKQENYIDVSEAHYHGSHEENFYDVQLVVKGQRNIYESLDAIVEVEVLDGKNKYCLERDGQKSYHRAEKGVRFTSLPPVLLLHLARFDFDPERGDMCKILSRWDFYDSIDLTKYVTDAERSKPHPPGYFRYHLHSVLVHSGSDARFGHYFCFVNTATSDGSGAGGGPQWYKFNDEVVSSAALADVFGANFGGFKQNYWGSEVPLTTNAYLLIYVRESDMASILKPVDASLIPPHVKHQLAEDAARAARAEKERSEAHLYGCVHMISGEDVEEHPVLLCNQAPLLQFPEHRTMRILLTADAVGACVPFAAKHFGFEDETDVALWIVYSVSGEGSMSPLRRLGRRVLKGVMVKECCVENESPLGSRNGCMFVTSLRDRHLIMPPGKSRADVFGRCGGNDLILTHHKFYDALELKIRYIDYVVSPSDVPVSEMSAFIAERLVELKLLKSSSCELTASLEDTGPSYNAHAPEVLSPRSGDVFVWQERVTDPLLRDAILYPTLDEFLVFQRRRVPVDICRLQFPSFPKLISTELSDEMSYEQLQRFVARRINESNFDLIRFSRHNPDTKQPYFMKNKKAGGTNLRTLLTVNNNPRLNTIVYFEICPYTVTAIESSNSFQFEFFDPSVRYGGNAQQQIISQPYWLLFPDPPTLTMQMLFSKVAETIKVSPPPHPPMPSNSDATHSKKIASTDTATRSYLNALEPTSMRLVDVWKSRIYNIYDLSVPITSRFEESAEYRIEIAPAPIPDVASQDQMLLHFFHFSRAPGGKIVTHSDPFSSYVSSYDTLSTLRERVSKKLNLSEQQTEDWKFSFVYTTKVVEIKGTELLGEQLEAFARQAALTNPPPPPSTSNGKGKTSSRSHHADPNAGTASAQSSSADVVLSTVGGGYGSLSIFQANQKDGTLIAFIGMEHAASPGARRTIRREECALKIFN